MKGTSIVTGSIAAIALLALVDCLVLAATSYLVKGRSNLSDASLVFNPQLPYSFRPDVPFPPQPPALSFQPPASSP